ncbi:hypothetical protein [Nocardiopsis oceani]
MGPDPSPWEVTATLASALVGTLIAVGACLSAGLPWTATAVVGLVAFDFFGGAAATATAASKRRYHGPGRTLRHRLLFVAAHVQPFVLALFVPGLGWWTAAALYLLALTGAVAVGLTPSTLRAPVALGATVTGSAAALVLLPVPGALVWLAPVMLVKLLIGHMLPGAEQRTAGEADHGTEEDRQVGAA